MSSFFIICCSDGGPLGHKGHTRLSHEGLEMSLNDSGFAEIDSDALRKRRTNDSLEPLGSPPAKQIRDLNYLTLTWSEVPAWMQDNEYILSGYRRLVDIILNMGTCSCFKLREQNSIAGCIHSIFGCEFQNSVVATLIPC